jgi:hypothetical protein
MSWIASIFLALLTGALGVICGWIVGSACVNWYHISGFEGGAGYFALAIAFWGGVLGLIVGAITGRVVGTGTVLAFFKALGLSCGTTVGVAGIAALICWGLADIPPRIDGYLLDLQVEIRLPVGETNLPVSTGSKPCLRLGSLMNHVQRKSETGELNLAEARFEGGRWIIPGSVLVFTTRGKRMIEARIDAKSIAAFLVPLPARPGKACEQWSTWLPRTRPGNPPWPDDKPSYRFRVERLIPPPPPPDPEVVRSEKFMALKTDAPVKEWLDFLDNYITEERMKTVMQVVEERPNDLAEAIRSADKDLRDRALLAVRYLSKVDPKVSEAVLAEGRDIVENLRRFNEMKETESNFLNVQVELRSRFNSWHHAWWTVHQKTGVDGRPPVQEILDLARVRARETTMDEIVANAQAHLGGLPPRDPTQATAKPGP